MSFNLSIYEDLARLQEEYTYQDKVNTEMVMRGWAAIINYCLEKNIPFTRYLSDSAMIMEFLLKEGCEPGKFILFVAPCDSGKTKTMLEEFATALSGKRNLIVATPITLQSEQNAQMYHSVGKNDVPLRTISVTGASHDTFDLSKPNAYSTVYDSTSRLMKLSKKELSKVVFIVDEAHQMNSAKKYRGAAINKLWKLIRMILNAGGTVIFMTGTPSKILGMPFDYRVSCVRTVFNESRTDTSLLEPVHERNFGKIDVIRKDSHEYNMEDLTIATALQMIQNGETPLIRVNDKNMIARIAHALRMNGIPVATLSADDKGCKIIDTDDGREFKYDSLLYESIMNTGLLQKRGCYICTSLLEVGTSIKGIIDEHGTVFQPETLVPVFVCLQPTDSDTDAMEQFFARPRFKFNRAMILMNLPESRMYSAERMSLDRIMGVVWAEAQHNANVLNEDQHGSRLMLTRMNGREETELVTFNGTEYVVDLNEVIAKGYAMHDMLIYMFPSETVHMLEDRFKVPVSQTIVSGTKPYNFNKNRELPEALTNEIEKIKNGEGSITMDKLKDIIMNPVGGQSTENALERLRNCGRESGNPEDESIGMSYIRLLQQYLGCPIYSLNVAMDLAAQKLANPHRRPVNPVTDQKIDFKLDSQHGMFSIMFKFTQVQQDYFMDAYDIWHNPNSSKASAYDKSNPLFLFPTEDHFCLSANMDSPMLKDFMVLMNRHRYKLNWRQVCLGAMHMCEEEFHGYVQSLTYVPWNKFEYGSNDYLMAVQPNTSVIGAEYDILRNPQRSFYYYDYETAMQLSVNPDYAKAENFPGKKVFFADGLIGKTITDHDLESMAKCMNQAVNYRCPSAKQHIRYTAAQMYYTIKAIFIVEETKTADGILLEIVGLRQRAVRLNAPDKDAMTEMRQNMFREIDEAMIDIRYDKAATRNRVELILNEGLKAGCFTRKFVDTCVSELSKFRTYGTWDYDFDYQIGMVQAMYDLIEKRPDEPCTLEEINRTNFGTKGVMAYDEYSKLDTEMMCIALPKDFHERELTAEEQLQLKAFSMRKEQLTLVINERCEIMKQAKAATEKAFADDCIIFETADYGIGRNGLIAKFREPKPVTTEQALAFVTQEPKGPGNEKERLAG